MISAKKLIQLIDEKRRRLGFDNKQFADKAQINESRWHDLKGDRGKLHLEELAKLASAMEMSLQLVDKHHAPFMNLTPQEAMAVMRMVAHMKRNGPQLPSIFQDAANKLEAELNKHA